MKKFLISTVLVMICLFAHSQDKAQINGVVTYLVNDHIGTRADVGSLIYIHSILKSDTLHDVLNNNRLNQMIYNTSLMMSDKIRTSEFRESLKIKKQNYEGSKILADDYLSTIENSKEVIKITVDGTGNYSAQIPLGFYEIICVSKNRAGRILNKKIMIESDNEIIDFDFGRI